jgi:hypothetical protein
MWQGHMYDVAGSYVGQVHMFDVAGPYQRRGRAICATWQGHIRDVPGPYEKNSTEVDDLLRKGYFDEHASLTPLPHLPRQ